MCLQLMTASSADAKMWSSRRPRLSGNRFGTQVGSIASGCARPEGVEQSAVELESLKDSTLAGVPGAGVKWRAGCERL